MPHLRLKNPAEHITYKCNMATQACNGITNIYIKGKKMGLGIRIKANEENENWNTKHTDTKRSDEKKRAFCNEFMFICT